MMKKATDSVTSSSTTAQQPIILRYTQTHTLLVPKRTPTTPYLIHHASLRKSSSSQGKKTMTPPSRSSALFLLSDAFSPAPASSRQTGQHLPGCSSHLSRQALWNGCRHLSSRVSSPRSILQRQIAQSEEPIEAVPPEKGNSHRAKSLMGRARRAILFDEMPGS